MGKTYKINHENAGTQSPWNLEYFTSILRYYNDNIKNLSFWLVD